MHTDIIETYTYRIIQAKSFSVEISTSTSTFFSLSTFGAFKKFYVTFSTSRSRNNEKVDNNLSFRFHAKVTFSSVSKLVLCVLSTFFSLVYVYTRVAKGIFYNYNTSALTFMRHKFACSFKFNKDDSKIL